jgi:hypothetical protein
MKRLTYKQKNAGIVIISLDSDTYSEYKKNMFTALKKFGSGKKTRAVHKLIDSNLVYPALFSGDAANAIGAITRKDNHLNGIILNNYLFDDSLTGDGIVKLSNRLLDIDKKIKKEETYVNEVRLHNLEKLQEKYKETQEKLLKSFDYIKIIDGIYFLWLKMLSEMAVLEDSSGKAKVVTVTSELLADILKKLYLKIKKNIGKEEHQLLEAIAYYFIKMYFYGESSTYALNSLKKAFNEETIDAIEKTKVNKIDKFEDISKVLRGTELLPITENTFNLFMNDLFGKLGYEQYIQTSLVNFMAFMANLAHPNQLFKKAFSVNDESHERLEELLLNEKKRIVIDPKDVI